MVTARLRAAHANPGAEQTLFENCLFLVLSRQVFGAQHEFRCREVNGLTALGT
jgi:hypothetical protein